MSAVACRVVSPWITAMGAGEDVSFAPATRHITRCLRCQARLARARRMRRDLRSLADEQVEAPMEALDLRDEPPDVRAARPLVILGTVAAVAAGVIGLRRILAH